MFIERVETQDFASQQLTYGLEILRHPSLAALDGAPIEEKGAQDFVIAGAQLLKT